MARLLAWIGPASMMMMILIMARNASMLGRIMYVYPSKLPTPQQPKAETPQVMSCSDARTILDRHNYLTKPEQSTVKCITFINGTFTEESFLTNIPNPFGVYKGLLKRFLSDLVAYSDEASLAGVAIADTVDQVQFPVELAKELMEHGVPILAHALDSSIRDHVVMIPDFHFIQYKAFSNLTTALAKRETPFAERSKRVYWRGRTTGVPCETAATIVSVANHTLRDTCTKCVGLQRIAAAQISTDTPWLDIELTKAVQSCSAKGLERLFPRSNPTGEKHNEEDWILARGILDIDGNANAWGARWRLESGSVIFKVESNVTNAYLSRLEPYVHYIPIHANLSNLASLTKLVQSDEAIPFLQGIAQNARDLMRQDFTYNAEIDRVRSELRHLWRKIK